MIKVDYVEPCSPGWTVWKKKAAAEIARVVKTYNPRSGAPPIDETLYTERMDDLRDAFHRKCAYCEVPIPNAGADNVGHYRPQFQVAKFDGEPVEVNDQGQTFSHPGYYWLAYDPANLVYVCHDCAREKRNRFPVANDSYAWERGHETTEVPLLFHPVIENPEQYFLLESSTGFLIGIDERAQVSIELLQLNREYLRDARRTAFLQTETMMLSLRNVNVATTEQVPGFIAKLEVLIASRKRRWPFSFVIRKVMEQHEDILKQFQRLLTY